MTHPPTANRICPTCGNGFRGQRWFCDRACYIASPVGSKHRPRPPLRIKEVALAPLRARYYELREADVSASTICRRLGWMRKDRPLADISRLKRALGIQYDVTYHDGKPYRSKRQTTSYENAVRLADALGCDPVEVGL